MKKIVLIFLTLLILIILLLSRDQKILVGEIIKDYTPKSFYNILLFVFDNNRNSKRISNDYNVVFLPKTQHLDTNFKKLNLDFLEKSTSGYLAAKKLEVKTFYIENYGENLFILDTKGRIYFNSTKNILEDKNHYSKIDSNLTSVNGGEFIKTLDFEIFKEKIYISKVIKKDNCFYLIVDSAELNSKLLNFKNIFSTINRECANHHIQAGKLEIFKDSLLLTTGADINSNKDETDPKPQDDNSIYGKILKVNINNSSFEIFNKGHRNSLGLYADNNIILSTENGPRGGDEINVEIQGQNYGWDLASYGKKYRSNFKYQDHEKNGFQEPLFAFVPSIGISEIIKLKNNFSNEWDDNYLVGSLMNRHLYRVKFNSQFSKVIFMEKIFVGERIRDLTYDAQTQTIFLALEDSGSIGLLRSSKN